MTTVTHFGSNIFSRHTSSFSSLMEVHITDASTNHSIFQMVGYDKLDLIVKQIFAGEFTNLKKNLDYYPDVFNLRLNGRITIPYLNKVKKDPNINFRGWSILHLAVASLNRLSIIAIHQRNPTLIHKGYSYPNSKSFSNYKPIDLLMYIHPQKAVEIFKDIFQANPIKLMSNDSLYCLFHEMIIKNQFSLVQASLQILSKNGLIKLQSKMMTIVKCPSEIARMITSYLSCVRCPAIEELINHSATIPDHHGIECNRTPLALALQQDDLEPQRNLLALILEAGANPYQYQDIGRGTRRRILHHEIRRSKEKSKKEVLKMMNDSTLPSVILRRAEQIIHEIKEFWQARLTLIQTLIQQHSCISPPEQMGA